MGRKPTVEGAPRSKATSVTFTEEEADALFKISLERSEAEGKRISVSDVIREAVIAHLGLARPRPKKAR